MAATHTHAGHKPNVAYVNLGRLFGHSSPVAGKVHALVAVPGGYLALCGERVAASYEDGLTGERITGHVAPAGERKVTCARCRKVLGTTRWAAQCRNGNGVWYTTRGGGGFASEAEAEAWLAELRAQFPGRAFRVRRV